jgi:prohibitin 2
MVRDFTEHEATVGSIVKIVGLAFLGLMLVIGIFSSWYIVGAGERAIVLTWGSPSMDAQGSGLHFKIPFVQTVVKMDVQTQKYEAKASAASKDLQTVNTDLAVNYHLVPESVPLLYQNIGTGYREKIIQPAVQEIVKASTAGFTAEELITKRALVKENIDKLLAERLLPSGIIVETTNIVNFDFSEQFNKAIEAKVTAEQEALTQKNKLAQKEYEAQQVVATAKGDAEATILNAEAEAKKVQLVNNQLSQSPQYVEYIKAQKWDGHFPEFYMTGGNSPNLLMQLPTTQTTSLVASSTQ